MLAAQMVPKYRYENCAVVALDDGGVMVGTQIAIQLHCIITLLQLEEVMLPREPKAIAGMTDGGKFVYNKDYTDAEIDEITGEYHGLIDQERLEKLHRLNSMTGRGSLIHQRFLRHMNVILVSDGLDNTLKLDLAAEYLKPIAIESLTVATPIATVPVIDKIHVMADAVYCLSVTDDFLGTDHYYEIRDIPDHAKIVDTIENIVLHWKN